VMEPKGKMLDTQTYNFISNGLKNKIVIIIDRKVETVVNKKIKELTEKIYDQGFKEGYNKASRRLTLKELGK